MSSLFLCFDSQLKRLRTEKVEKVTHEVKKLESKDLDDIVDDLSIILDTLMKSSLNSFNKSADDLVFEGSNWEQKVEYYKKDLQSRLNDVSSNCKEKILGKLSVSS